MKQSKYLIALVAWSVIRTATVAQVNIVSATIDPYQFAPTTFLSATIYNASAPALVRLQGDVRAVGGAQVLRFRSAPLLVPSGTSRVERQSYSMEQFVRSGDSRYFSAGMDQRLSAGDYEFCVSVEPFAEDEMMAPYCGDQFVEDLTFMDLVSPMDGDTIDEVRPALTWILTEGGLPVGHSARLSIVPKHAGIDAYQARATSRPMFLLDDVRPGMVGFPVSAPDLERGRCYSWQVERLSNGLAIDRTEAWYFCVRPRRRASPDRYVRVGPYVSDALAEAKDDMLHILCDEASSAEAMELRVLLPQGAAISDRDAARGGRPVLRAMGDHLFEVDLGPCRLKGGEYVLVLLEAGRELGRIRFRIPS